MRPSPFPPLAVFLQRSELDAVFERPAEADKYWADDKQRTTEVLQADRLWMEARLCDQHAEKQRFDSKLRERTFGEAKACDRQTDRYWSESRHPDRQWTVDRHTQRQIDRKIERQWMGGRQIDRSWSDNRQGDVQGDGQRSEVRHLSRRTERHVQALPAAQRPLLPYPSDRTPSPQMETDRPTGTEAPDRQQQDTQGDGQMCPDAGGASTEGWRSCAGEGGGRAAPCASKPDPPPQSSKPSLPKPRQRHRLESSEAFAGNSPSGVLLQVQVLQRRKHSVGDPSFFYLCRSRRGRRHGEGSGEDGKERARKKERFGGSASSHSRKGVKCMDTQGLICCVKKANVGVGKSLTASCQSKTNVPVNCLCFLSRSKNIQPKTSSYVTFPKESPCERNLPPPPVPPPLRPVPGLADRAASQGNAEPLVVCLFTGHFCHVCSENTSDTFWTRHRLTEQIQSGSVGLDWTLLRSDWFAQV